MIRNRACDLSRESRHNVWMGYYLSGRFEECWWEGGLVFIPVSISISVMFIPNKQRTRADLLIKNTPLTLEMELRGSTGVKASLSYSTLSCF